MRLTYRAVRGGAVRGVQPPLGPVLQEQALNIWGCTHQSPATGVGRSRPLLGSVCQGKQGSGREARNLGLIGASSNQISRKGCQPLLHVFFRLLSLHSASMKVLS